ncbi:hypothetical protein ABID65_008793 [Bradyrhizobium sp. S3.9.2]
MPTLKMPTPRKRPTSDFYWIRKKVPLALRRLVGKTEVWASLGTKDERKALIKIGAVTRAAGLRANARTRPMSEVTYYVRFAVRPFAPGEATECFSANAAVMRAEALSRKPGHVGAIAFRRTGDPAIGEFGDAKLLRKFGEAPDDLSAL